MAGAASVTTFVMENRLPWPEDDSMRDLHGPFDAGVIHGSGTKRTCAIRRISSLGATVRGNLAITPGEDVGVELVNGQRQPGSIDWVSGDEAGIVFKQPVDMLALINRNLISQPTERRAMPRVELRCRLHLKWGVSLAPATMRNISARGLQVEGDELPGRGTFVSIYVEGLNVPPGEVVWSKGRLAGIELLDELSWSSLIPWIREQGRKAV